MKNAIAAVAAYESPESWVLEIDRQDLICTSPTGAGNEQYEDGDTSGWFNL